MGFFVCLGVLFCLFVVLFVWLFLFLLYIIEMSLSFVLVVYERFLVEIGFNFVLCL